MTKKHRTFSPEFKARAVLAVLSGDKTAAEICREHQINVWVQTMETSTTMIGYSAYERHLIV